MTYPIEWTESLRQRFLGKLAESGTKRMVYIAPKVYARLNNDGVAWELFARL